MPYRFFEEGGFLLKSFQHVLFFAALLHSLSYKILQHKVSLIDTYSTFFQYFFQYANVTSFQTSSHLFRHLMTKRGLAELEIA